MKKSLLLFLLSLLTFSLRAEYVLTLTNPETGETERFRKGSYMVFELKKDSVLREGFISGIQDSSISFEGNGLEGQVMLSEIRFVAGSTREKIKAGHVANAVGNAVMLTGMTVFDCGINLIANTDYYFWPVGGSIWLAGAFIAGIGYAVDWASSPHGYSVRVRSYRDWEARISNDEKETGAVRQEPEKKIRDVNDDDVYGE